MTEVAEITIRRCADTVDQYDDVNRVYTLGLADHAEVGDENLGLLFSILEPDAGPEGYSLTAEPGQRTAFSAVAQCEVSDGFLRLVFTADAAAALELPRTVSLRLEIDDDAKAVLAKGLGRVGIHCVDLS